MTTYKPITKTKNKDDVFNMWLERINQIEKTIGESENMNLAFDTAYIVFPLLDSISFNLFGKDAYIYFKELGLNPSESAILTQVFRNGFIHNLNSYDLEYSDGNVDWSIFTTAGTGGIRPYDDGYKSKEFPEDNIDPEKVLEYEDVTGGSYKATLYLDRLIALIRHDLKKRQESYPKDTIEFIVGQKMEGKRPKIL